MKAFVLMPFDVELQDVYTDFIKEVSETAGFEVQRADDLLSQQSILADIVVSIAECDLIIADLTGSNPNVYYELGIAHAFDKPAILLAQDIDEVPFDLRSYRIVPYGTHFSEMKRAREQLQTLLRQALEGQLRFGSPVSDHSVKPIQSALVASPREHELSPDEPARTEGQEEDEPGLMDHMVDLEEGISELGVLARQIAAETETIGERTTETGHKLHEANDGARQISAAERRKLVRELAQYLDSYGSSIGDKNASYRDALNRASNALEAILQGDLQTSDAEELSNFLEAIHGMKSGAEGAMSAMKQMRDSLRGVPKLERTFSRARQLALRELSSLIENLERTIAMATRAEESGSTAMSRLQAGGEERSKCQDGEEDT